MKKALLLLLALMLVLSLAACGGKNENIDSELTSNENSTGDTQENTDDNSTQPTENDINSDNSITLTKEEFLSFFGLDIDSIKPNGFTDIEIYGCTTKEGDVYLQVDEASITSENVQAWFEKMYDKIKQISDDGKLYDSFTFNTEYQLPISYGTMVYSTFTYKYGGKGVLVILSYDPLGFSMSKNEIKKISTYQIALAF